MLFINVKVSLSKYLVEITKINKLTLINQQGQTFFYCDIQRENDLKIKFCCVFQSKLSGLIKTFQCRVVRKHPKGRRMGKEGTNFEGDTIHRTPL